MHNAQDTKNLINFIGILIVILASTMLWININLNVHMDTDTGWLLQCLDRFLSGGNYSTDFYETNPPLSFLIYLPAYPLYATNIIPAKAAILIVFLLYMALANTLLYLLLRKIPVSNIESLSLIACLILSQTWMSNIGFGSKDHLIFIFLLPYCIYQILMIANRPTPKGISIAASLLAGLAVCIKPHYAIIPALFFLHRLVKHGSPAKTALSSDFIIIAAITVITALFYALRFPDFFTVILPDLNSIYSNEERFDVSGYLIFLSLPILALICSGFLSTNSPDYKNLKSVIYALSILAAILFIPFAVQGKGFEYQAIPFRGTALSIFMFSLFCLINHHIKQPAIIIFLIFALGISALYKLNTGKDKTFLTPEEFTSLPYHQKLEEHAWNNVYASFEFHSLVLALPYYSDLKNGSRFGQLWPLSGLSQKLQQPRLPEKEKEVIKDKMHHYISMLATDIERFKPSVISIPQYMDPKTGKPSKKYLDFLLSNPDLKEKMQDYNFVESVDFDKSLIVTGIKDEKDKYLRFDLFQRKKD